MYSVVGFSTEYNLFPLLYCSLFSRTNVYEFYNPKKHVVFNASDTANYIFQSDSFPSLNISNDLGTLMIFRVKSRYANMKVLNRNPSRKDHGRTFTVTPSSLPYPVHLTFTTNLFNTILKIWQ